VEVRSSHGVRRPYRRHGEEQPQRGRRRQSHAGESPHQTVILRSHVHHSAAAARKASATAYIHQGRAATPETTAIAPSPPARLLRDRFETSGSTTLTANLAAAPPLASAV